MQENWGPWGSGCGGRTGPGVQNFFKLVQLEPRDTIKISKVELKLPIINWVAHNKILRGKNSNFKNSLWANGESQIRVPGFKLIRVSGPNFPTWSCSNLWRKVRSGWGKGEGASGSGWRGQDQFQDAIFLQTGPAGAQIKNKNFQSGVKPPHNKLGRP